MIDIILDGNANDEFCGENIPVAELGVNEYKVHRTNAGKKQHLVKAVELI